MHIIDYVVGNTYSKDMPKASLHKGGVPCNLYAYNSWVQVLENHMLWIHILAKHSHEGSWSELDNTVEPRDFKSAAAIERQLRERFAQIKLDRCSAALPAMAE